MIKNKIRWKSQGMQITWQREIGDYKKWRMNLKHQEDFKNEW